MQAIHTVLDGYHRLLKVLLGFLMAALIVPVTMQILSRHTGVIPRYIWTEEIARFCFVWIVLLGAMIAVRDRTHFDVDLLPQPSTPRGELVSKLIVHAAIVLVGLTFVIWGRDFAILGSRQRSEIASLPMLTIYIAWPVAGVTWLVFTAENIARDVAAYRRASA